MAPLPRHERPGPARDRHRPRRQRAGAGRRVRSHRRLRDHGGLLPRELTRRPRGAARPHADRPGCVPRRRSRGGARGHRRHGGAVARRARPEPRPDDRRLAGARPRRPLRQYRAWLQLNRRDRCGAAACGLCRDRSRFRRRSRGRKVLRHQVPRRGPRTRRPRSWSRPVRALKMHGGVAKADLGRPDPEAVRRGSANLARHVENVQTFGVPVVVAINHFTADGAAEIAEIEACCGAARGLVVSLPPLGRGRGRGRATSPTRWRRSATGAPPASPRSIPTRCRSSTRSRRSRGRSTAPKRSRSRPAAAKKLARFEANGFGHLPVCMAKTPYSFSSDPALIGPPPRSACRSATCACRPAPASSWRSAATSSRFRACPAAPPRAHRSRCRGCDHRFVLKITSVAVPRPDQYWIVALIRTRRHHGSAENSRWSDRGCRRRAERHIARPAAP